MTKPAKNNGFCRVLSWAFLPVFLAFFCSTPGLVRGETVPTPEVLTNAADVLLLSLEQALQEVPVFVRGVVTEAEPNWRGQFFVQDDTSGVFVENHTDTHPEPGDVVEVEGVSHPGAFAPGISKPKWKKVGTAPLPEAKEVPVE